MGNKFLLSENHRTYSRFGLSHHEIPSSLPAGYVRGQFIPITISPVVVDYLDLFTTGRQRPRIQNDATIAMVMATSKALMEKYDLMLSINGGEIVIKKDFRKFKFLRGY